jgi:ribosomal protein S18 acetylase RimI-like enzyme
VTESSSIPLAPPRLDANRDARAVRKATLADVPRLAAAMARAFYDDPVVGWCWADEPRRMARLQRGFGLFLRRVYLRHEECYATADLVGAAFWLPPEAWRLGGFDRVRLIAPMGLVHGRALPRILRLLSFLEARHPHERHYYLQFIGVEPERQGRGIGSALLRPMLVRCDRERMPAYLEASSERSRGLYERHGFELVERVDLPAGGPPMWRMWRP